MTHRRRLASLSAAIVAFYATPVLAQPTSQVAPDHTPSLQSGAAYNQFHHVGVSVANLEAEAVWYEKALGFKRGYTFGSAEAGFRGLFMTNADNLSVEILERKGSAAGANRADPQSASATRGYGHFALLVPDLDATVARVVAAGGKIASPPRKAPEPNARVSFVTDVEDNLVELIEKTP